MKEIVEYVPKAKMLTGDLLDHIRCSNCGAVLIFAEQMIGKEFCMSNLPTHCACCGAEFVDVGFEKKGGKIMAKTKNYTPNIEYHCGYLKEVKIKGKTYYWGKCYATRPKPHQVVFGGSTNG